MNKVIAWVNTYTVDEIVEKILSSNVNIDGAILQLLEARKEIGLKIQDVIKRLEEIKQTKE
jgi:chorismate mutase